MQKATIMEAAMFIMFNMCVHVHACMHVCVCVHAWGCYTQPHPHPTPPHPPLGGTSRISKNYIKLEQIKIFQLCFKFLNLWRFPIPMGGCIVWWVDGWVGLWVKSCEITKNLIKLDLIEMIQFCLEIYDLWTHCPPMGGWMGGSLSGFMSNEQKSNKSLSNRDNSILFEDL